MTPYSYGLLSSIEEKDAYCQLFGFKKRTKTLGNKSGGLKQAAAYCLIAKELFLLKTYPFSTDDTAKVKSDWPLQQTKWLAAVRGDKDALANTVCTHINTYVIIQSDCFHMLIV